MSDEPKYDNRELLDAYDRVSASGLHERISKELARQKPEVFIEIFYALTRDKEVAERLAGVAYPKVDEHIIAGELINAIKQYRAETGESLKESKDWCERRREELRARGKIPINQR